MLNKLRQHLASITPDQFQTEWAEIEAMGFGGPTVEEFLKSLKMTPTFSTIKIAEIVVSPLSDQYNLTPIGNYSLANAA